MKRFSLAKFIRSCLEGGHSDRVIMHSVRNWALDCDGMTQGEMWDKKGCGTSDKWMVDDGDD